jgi:DNA/RNA-binding domain of Phe-tRNA-synthetase-like protein
VPIRRYTIDERVFRQFPGYVRGVVLAYDVNNYRSPPGLLTLLRDAEIQARHHFLQENVAEHPNIRSWREAYRTFGAKPAEFHSSIEAMSRRVLKGQKIPSINALVDIGNIISLRHLVPAGVHAIDVLTQDISLRPATGEEEFVAYGMDTIEHPLHGEIIFAEGNVVLTRRWTWRQSQHTLTQLDSRSVEYNVDGLMPVSSEKIAMICQEVSKLVRQFCGGRVSIELLTLQHPSLEIES